jgi:hypothetical protein
MFGILGSAVGGLGIGTYIKIGLVVVLALALGGLYWYGQHEAAAVVDLTKLNGAQAQIIADDKANIDALETANKNWAAAFAKYQHDVQAQADAYKLAIKLKENINAKLNAIEALLRSGKSAAATVSLNALNDQLVCLLDHAAGGSRDDCPIAAASTAGSASPARP